MYENIKVTPLGQYGLRLFYVDSGISLTVSTRRLYSLILTSEESKI